jgi:hypothetical protein
MKTLKTCKTGCGKMATGGVAKMKKVKKMAKGGAMYGIPQENLGTSGQYGFAKTGGSVKKTKLAALAAPKDKITRADIIAGAKMKMRKKKK